jgi:hypothetical protein
MNDSDIVQVNEVYNTAYGNIRPDRYFEWEFLNGPWGKAIYVIAEDMEKSGNKIIGTQSAIPIVMTDGVSEVLTAKSEDTFVHPDYRGQKLFDKMYDMLFDECIKSGIQYIWGFTYAKKPFEKIGFSIPFSTVQGIKVNRPMKAAKTLIALNPANNLKSKLKIFLGSYYSYFKTISQKGGEVETEIDSDFNLFSNRQKFLLESEGLWSIKFTPEYLQWRLNKNPYPNDFYSMTNSNKGILFNSKKDGVIYVEDILTEIGEINNTEID